MKQETQRIAFPVKPLEDIPALKGKKLEFSSIAEMFTQRAAEIPDRIHVLFYDQKITYAMTNDRANQVAGFLASKSVSKGDVVSLMVMNSPEIYYTMFGAQKIGAVAGVINFALMGPEIAHVLNDSKPKVVFVGSDFMPVFARGYEIAEHKPVVVEVKTEAAHDETIAETTLTGILADFSTEERLVPQKPEDPFLLLYSSGTTGLPKGILLSNKGQLDICHDMSVTGLMETDNEIMLILLPMFHINPIGVWTYPITYLGQTLCIRRAFSPEDFWPAIMENGVTIVMGVPAMYNYVYYSIDAGVVDRSRLDLRYAFCGAAPLSVELIKGFKEKFDVDIIEGYGLTEATGVSTANPVMGTRKPGSCGLVMPLQEIEIMDLDNQPLPPGEKGEICLKGGSQMIAYLNRPEATEETLVDGWLHTGDIGYLDEDGYLYVVDRKKDMINRGGENIYPREIEIVLEAHPEVNSVAVIGIPDEALGERVKAAIEPVTPGRLTPEGVREYLKDKIAKYKIPEIIDIVDALPRNPTGKILKYKLREE